MLTTYADLKAACTTWARRADLANYLDDLIALAEERIFREVRCREMETALNLTISNGVIAVPTDYVELKYAYIDGTPINMLQRKEASWIYLKYPTRVAETKPSFIARDVTNFIFGPYPDSNYTVKGTYFKRLSVVQTSVNDLFTNYPDLYLSASLAEVFRFTRDDKMTAYWESRYADIRDKVNGESKMENASGGPLTMVAM